MKILVVPSLCIASLITLASSAHAQLPSQIQAKAGPITDTRTAGDNMQGGLEITVKFSGVSLADTKSVQGSVKSAVDDTGRDLLDPQNAKVEPDRLSGNQDAGVELKLTLKNPARNAATIKTLTGEAELFMPKADPDSIVKVESFQATGGKKVASPGLSAAKIELTPFTKDQVAAAKAKGGEFGSVFDMGMGDQPNSITVLVKDPQRKLVEIEFQDASGAKVTPDGWGSSGDGSETVKYYSFQSKLPDNTRMVVYLSTEKSVVKVPFTLTNIALP